MTTFDLNTGYSIISTILAILIIVGKWGIFEKMGEEGWKSLIPFYGEYILFNHIWTKKMYWIALALELSAIAFFVIAGIGCVVTNSMVTLGIGVAVSGVLLVAVCVIGLMAIYKLAKAFGQGKAFTVGLVLLSGIFYMILGFGKYDYEYNSNMGSDPVTEM